MVRKGVLSQDEGVDILKDVAECQYTPKFEDFGDVGRVAARKILESEEYRKVEGQYLARWRSFYLAKLTRDENRLMLIKNYNSLPNI